MFARGDVEAATAVLDPACAGTAPATTSTTTAAAIETTLAFIRRALAAGVTAEAFDFRDAGDRVVVLLQTHQPHEWGQQPHPHGEVVTVRDGKVVEMVVYPTVDEALAAAALEG